MILCERMRASSSSGLRVTAIFLLNSFKRVNCVLIASLLPLTTLDSSLAQSKIDFSRDVRPILARHCFACHGPDEAQREGGLRLDTEAGLSTPADSGKLPVQPGKPVQSELLDRILGQSGDRMPPEDHAAALEEKHVLTLRAWIEQGATWNRHFAFLPLDSSPTLSVDTEIQRRHEHPIDLLLAPNRRAAGVRPAPSAKRRTLIRRLYLDTLGVPPDAEAVKAFVEDSHPAAWERLVDRVLASPLYGQRWARHWLDVARYGDSNGGDENHAYPHAFRYRDWTVDAWNHDLPFDDFVRWQIAGDLTKQIPPPFDHRAATTATGFLALGTKILAEKDPVKKQADIVDEQIDAMGRAFLGLTLGCARCHDHKFDPITQNDYYALAGIFHSSTIEMEQGLWTPENEVIAAQVDEAIEVIRAEKKTLEAKSETMLGKAAAFEAEDFDRGNIIVDRETYGVGIGIIGDPGAQENFVEYDLEIETEGLHLIRIRYAARTSRPGQILIDGERIKENAMAETTGGWMPEHQRWSTEASLELTRGAHILRIESQPMMVHIDKIAVIPADKFEGLAPLEKQLAELKAKIDDLVGKRPAPIPTMTMSEGEVKDVALHIRGSHLDLGDLVSRGMPSVLTSIPSGISNGSSGRQELADWLVDPEQGGRLSRRVMVNRLWHWHFGQGLVASTDDFGLQASPLKHEPLLDFMASELVHHAGSIKQIQRLILTSAAYRMDSRDASPESETADPANSTWHRWESRRLDAETLRDTMLWHAGRLDLGLLGENLSVKAQDPSPTDLQNNHMAYSGFRRRSVYLPIVRSNTYKWLTLFDFPNSSACVGKRDETVVPTQALMLLNDQHLVDLAKDVARAIVSELAIKDGLAGTKESPASVVDPQAYPKRLFVKLLGREPSAQETTVLADMLSASSSSVSSEESREPSEIQIQLAHVLLMSNEFFYLP